MNELHRIRRLHRRLARQSRNRPRNPVPTTEYEFCEAFVHGRLTAEDIDRRNPDHTAWLGTLAALLTLRLMQ